MNWIDAILWGTILFKWAIEYFTKRQPVYEKGKVVTMPMKRWAAQKVVKSIQDKGYPSFNALFLFMHTRLMQEISLMVPMLVIVMGAVLSLAIGNNFPDYLFVFPALGIYWWPATLLYVDDLLTGDDKLKKLWKAARNKLRWAMKLPALRPAPSVG